MTLSRREWLVGAAVGLAGGVAATTAGAAELTIGLPASGERSARAEGTPTGVAALVAPLGAGATLGPWKVEQLVDLHEGASSLVLRDAEDAPFQLDICAHDDGTDALLPPGRSAHFDVYLANGGVGDTASREHHGLAAMAVADIIRQNEAHLSLAGYRTLRERLATAYDGVKRRA